MVFENIKLDKKIMFIPLWITNNNNFFSLRLFHFER